MTSTRTLAWSSNLDENKGKVSEKSYKIISPVSYLHAAPSLPLQTRNQTHLSDARTSSSRRDCSADVQCALLKSSGHGFTSVTVQVLSHVALENLRNELRTDPVSALANQCTVQVLRL